MTYLTKRFSSAALLLALAATALPAAAQTPAKSVCLAREANAAMTSAIPVDLPALASIQGLSGSAVVRLDVDERGIAANPAVVTSSGYAVLDTAAERAALEQTYAPRVHDCENVGGSYLVEVNFRSNDGS